MRVRQIGTMSLTNSKTMYRAGFSPLMGGVFVAPAPYCAHCSMPKHQECCNYVIEQIENMLHQQTAPSETAAILIEPVLGEGGVIVPPPSTYARVCSTNASHNSPSG
jgi:4-aminobutyrate aminotransferase